MALRDTLAKAKTAGRGGDTDIVHVNPMEEDLLHSMGGSGTINPRTGLREFYTDAFGGGFGNANAVDAGGTRGEVGFTSNSSHDAANAKGPSSFAPGTQLGVDQNGNYVDVSNLSSKQMGEMGITSVGAAPAPSNTKPGPAASAPATSAPATPPASQTQTIGNPDAIVSSQLANALGFNGNVGALDTASGNMGTANQDYQNTGNTTADSIGNFLARMFGLNEIDPTNAAKNPLSSFANQTDANWGFDPAGLVAGAAGSAFGVPGMGLVGDTLSKLLDRPAEINLGPDVMKTLGLGDFGQGLVSGTGDFINNAVGDHSLDAFLNSQYGGAASSTPTFQPGQGGGGAFPTPAAPAAPVAQQPATGGTGTGTDTGTGTGTGTGTPATPTRDQLIAQLRDLALLNDAFAAQNRGLNPADYSDAFNSYLDNLTANIPASATDMTALQGYFPSTIGDTTLDNYQTQKRGDYTNALNAFNWDPQSQSALGDTSDDSILQSIYDQQYNPAKQYVDYAHARGTLNDTGYNQALQSLTNQGTAAMSRLQDIGKAARTTDLSGIGDYTKSAYDKAGAYNLGETFDPNSYNTEFGHMLSGDVSGLEGAIRSGVPSGLFDTSSLLTDASRMQGATSGGASGGILNTLASRSVYNPYSARSRGLGTTGAF